MKPSERYQLTYSRPLPQGTGLQPQKWSDYKGIPLSDIVRQRMAEFRAIPSLYK